MPSLLTPAQFREHQATDLPDTALQRLIDAAEYAITARYGAIAQLTEQVRGGGRLLFLSRVAGAIASVTELYGDPLGTSPVVLDPTDYTQVPPGNLLRREYTGVHRADLWGERTDVVYTPADDQVERTRVTIGLVKLDVQHNPGLSAETVGDWAQTYADNSAMNYQLERDSILASMQSGLGFA